MYSKTHTHRHAHLHAQAVCSLRTGGLHRPCWCCSGVSGPKKGNGSEVKLFEELDEEWVWAKGKEPYKGAEYRPRDGWRRVRYMQIKKMAQLNMSTQTWFYGLTLPTCLTLLWSVGGDRRLNRGRDREGGGAVWKRVQGDLDMDLDAMILHQCVHYVCVYANVDINIYLLFPITNKCLFFFTLVKNDVWELWWNLTFS